MPSWRIPNAAVAVLLALALLGFLGPHLLMLGFEAAGTAPPSALVFLCPLEGGGRQGSHVSTPRDPRHVYISNRRSGSSPARAASMA